MLSELSSLFAKLHSIWNIEQVQSLITDTCGNTAKHKGKCKTQVVLAWSEVCLSILVSVHTLWTRNRFAPVSHASLFSETPQEMGILGCITCRNRAVRYTFSVSHSEAILLLQRSLFNVSYLTSISSRV